MANGLISYSDQLSSYNPANVSVLGHLVRHPGLTDQELHRAAVCSYATPFPSPSDTPKFALHAMNGIYGNAIKMAIDLAGEIGSDKGTLEYQD